MGVDISVWRSRIGTFNTCVRRSSVKRAKQSVCGGGCSGLEVVVVTAVLLVVVMAGELQSRIHQEHCELYHCVYTVLKLHILILYSAL